MYCHKQEQYLRYLQSAVRMQNMEQLTLPVELKKASP